MPEGDSLYQAAELLRPALVGQVIGRLHGSHRGLRADARRIAGRSVSAVRTVGKHLLIDFDNGWSLRTHLGMTGFWRRYEPGARWGVSPGKARVVLETASSTAVCFAAPTVELAPTERIHVEHLGPDLMAEDVDWDDLIARARRHGDATAADLLLDQRVMAGIGNVYKSEVLFLEKIDPHHPTEQLSDAAVLRLARRGRRLLLGNRAPRMRTTTGSRRPNANHWVYGRAGQACRRCGSTVRSDAHGALTRTTYWCPSCQPPATSPSAWSRSYG